MRVLFFFVTILGITFFQGYSQSFSLSVPDGTIINNGDTVIVVGAAADLELRAHIYVTNNASTTKTVKVRRTELSIVPGSENAFAFGMIEYAPFVSVSVGNDVGAAITDTSFVSFYFPLGFYGTSFIQYTFFDESNPGDSAWVVVEYRIDEVSGIAGTDPMPLVAFPNPAQRLVSISLPKSETGNIHLRIINSTGIMVYAAFLRQDRLSIDISSFPNGYYTIEAGGLRWKMIKQ